MKRILLVDDNAEELQELERTLEGAGEDWHIESANSGARALQKMAPRPFDLIVSDFLMPGMDGEQLFKAVMQQFPHTVRIMISGHFDWKITPRVMKITHQYLFKPWNAAELTETVRRAFFLRDLLANDSLRKLVKQLPDPPSLPAMYCELSDELGKDSPSKQRVLEIISRDCTMCARILQLVNSGFFGLEQRTATLEDSVRYLGVEAIKSLILALQLFARLQRSRLDPAFADQLWKHSWKTGILAKRITEVENTDGSLTEQAFTAGLLHDFGKLVLATGLPAPFQLAMQLKEEKNLSNYFAEEEVFGVSHAELGGYLLGSWGLPDAVVEAVVLHHRPSDCSSVKFSAVTAVHVANALAHELAGPFPTETAEVDHHYLARLQLMDHLPLWRRILTSVLSAQAA